MKTIRGIGVSSGVAVGAALVAIQRTQVIRFPVALAHVSRELAALDLESGEVAWKVNLQELFGEDTLWWDLGTSPVLTRDAVVVAVMQSGPSYLAAFARDDGRLLWKQERDLGAPEEAAQSYSTPVVVAASANSARWAHSACVACTFSCGSAMAKTMSARCLSSIRTIVVLATHESWPWRSINSTTLFPKSLNRPGLPTAPKSWDGCMWVSAPASGLTP